MSYVPVDGTTKQMMTQQSLSLCVAVFTANRNIPEHICAHRDLCLFSDGGMNAVSEPLLAWRDGNAHKSSFSRTDSQI